MFLLNLLAVVKVAGTLEVPKLLRKWSKGMGVGWPLVMSLFVAHCDGEGVPRGFF